jgi:hypothetical protein
VLDRSRSVKRFALPNLVDQSAFDSEALCDDLVSRIPTIEEADDLGALDEDELAFLSLC